MPFYQVVSLKIMYRKPFEGNSPRAIGANESERPLGQSCFRAWKHPTGYGAIPIKGEVSAKILCVSPTPRSSILKVYQAKMRYLLIMKSTTISKMKYNREAYKRYEFNVRIVSKLRYTQHKFRIIGITELWLR